MRSAAETDFADSRHRSSRYLLHDQSITAADAAHGLNPFDNTTAVP
jgi:hypothetical protein